MMRAVAGGLALVLLAGCATAQTPSATGLWGYTVDAPGARKLVALPDRQGCESVRAGDARDRRFSVPPACSQLVIGSGSDFWVLPATNLPLGSFLGSSKKKECETWEALFQAGTCRPVGVQVVQ